MMPLGLARLANPNWWQTPRHLRLLNRKLLDVAAGRIKRIMVMLPPRHGKSETCSHYFASWYLGTFPDKRVILASYEADFAASWGRKARDTLEEYGPQVFGVSVDPTSSAANRWNIFGRRGGMTTAGVGGPITGRGADLFIIDDPVKNAEEANSPTVREKHWQWYQAVARTRIEPGGAIILIMTRWHEDDLAGRLLRQMEEDPKADRWDVLRLPAIADENDPLGRLPGKALWPERYDEEDLAGIRASVGGYTWEALYQQRPAPPGGAVFKREWFSKVLGQAPDGLRWVRFWDLATSTASAADWTVGAKVGADRDGNLYIADIVRQRMEWPDTRRLIVATAKQDGPDVTVGVEKVAFQLAAWQDLMREPELMGYTVKAVGVDKSKELRAQPWAARAEAGKVYLVRGSWIGEFLSELETFPHGRHDDQVDAVSGAVGLLSQSRDVFFV